MARFTFPRSFYIPSGAIKVTDKNSDAVVYLYKNADDQVCAVGFHGKANKPDWRHRFASLKQREGHIVRHFERRRAHHVRMAEHRKEANKPHNLQVGHILRAMWGYDQTNIDYFQVTKVIGKTMVEIREIEAVSDCTGSMTGTCTPRLDAFKSKPMRRKVSYGRVSVDTVRRAGIWDGTPDNWTAYA